MIAALEVMAGFLKRGPAFFLHQPRKRLGKLRARIVGGRMALGFDEQRPARSHAAQRVVQSRRRGDQFALRRAVEVRPAKPGRALETAVLVQDDARCDQPGPRQPVGKQGRALAVFGEVQHRGVLPSHVKDAIRFRDEGLQPLAPVHTIRRRVLVEHPGCAGAGFFRRQVKQR